MITKEFTQGCDPEFALFDLDTKSYVSSIPFVKGTKQEPVALPSGGYAMRDNVAVEFGMPPAKSMVEWITNINSTIEELRNIIPDYFELTVVSSAHYPKQQLMHPEAREIGCMPDYNAWLEGLKNKPPQGFAEDTLRCFGGHLHIGYVLMSGNEFLVEEGGRLRVVKTCDCCHGIVSIILDNSPESQARKNLYGKAGCFRPTSYGVEYRTLSNFWCKTDTLKKLMFYLTADVLDIVRGKHDVELIDALGGADEVQRVINTGDIAIAEDMYREVLVHFLTGDTVATIEEVRDGE